jgi:hypothetical protein
LADTRDQREGNVVEMALVYQELSERFSYSQATLAEPFAPIAEPSHQHDADSCILPDHIVREISLGSFLMATPKRSPRLSDEEIEEVVA